MEDWFSGVEAAISGAAAGAVQSQSEWAGLKAQASAGTLRMEPGAAEACATACDGAIDAIFDHINEIRRATRVDGMGPWESGVQLAQKFSEKADGAANNNSAAGVLTLHQQVLGEMRDTFRAAGQAYAATEQGNVDVIQGTA
ncbi:hypothetical protein RHODO2019_00180 [Rhodococcus antarcticus]|uniref:PE family protein n=1 Tax=Rhodococcus antarcticus TaxID=2987751 RepID=A0ABY6P019_9NOCA|nr:hypothetical protein [Rhodococcus antarcticus]UZJ24975.1 hypothetical protein RHODO2019_00180 [Rhodococcus antarcticus]